MDENTMKLMEKHYHTVYENGTMDAQISALRRVVDREDIDTAERGYTSKLASVNTDIIRDIFGWEVCYEAREVWKRKEAEKAKAEQTDERSDG